MKKIVILGCGYLGYNIAMYFYKICDVTVIGLENDYSKKLNNNIKFYNKNLSDDNVFDKIDLKGCTVINAIGFLNSTNKLMDFDIALNELKLLNKITLKLNELKIENFIQISSGGTVYGDSNGKINECNTTNPINLYGLSKLFFEHYLKINFYESNLEYTIVRVSNPYGGYQIKGKNQGIIPIIINKVLDNEKLQLWASSETIRDYIYMDDFLNGLELIINRGKTKEIYNLGSGEGINIDNIINICENFLKSKIDIEFIKSNNKQIQSNILSIDKIKKLGFESKIDIKSGINNEIVRIKELR